MRGVGGDAMLGGAGVRVGGEGVRERVELQVGLRLREGGMRMGKGKGGRRRGWEREVVVCDGGVSVDVMVGNESYPW